MKIAIVGNINNGKGLQVDYELLKGALEKLGHQVKGLHYQQPPKGKYDIAIFLESYAPTFYGIAPRLWLVPNPEWWDFDVSTDDFELVLCKTRDAHRIFSEVAGDRARFTGWLTDDRYDPSVPRKPVALHVFGGSTVKGTRAVLEAWKDLAGEIPLITVGHVGALPKIANVTSHRRVTDAELKRFQNECAIHVQPSEYEGFGHILHESLSTGAELITTDAPPMNEIELVHLARVKTTGMMRRAVTCQVDSKSIVEKVRAAINVCNDEKLAAARGAQRRATVANTNTNFVCALEFALSPEKFATIDVQITAADIENGSGVLRGEYVEGAHIIEHIVDPTPEQIAALAKYADKTVNPKYIGQIVIGEGRDLAGEIVGGAVPVDELLAAGFARAPSHTDNPTAGEVPGELVEGGWRTLHATVDGSGLHIAWPDPPETAPTAPTPAVFGWPATTPPGSVPRPADGRTGPRVSIVFPVHRAGFPLAVRALAAITQQTVESSMFETIVVVDGGVDELGTPTEDLVAALDIFIYATKVIGSPRPRGDVPHRNHARNAGWRAAVGEYVAIVDCDFLIPPQFVEHLIAEIDAAAARGRLACFTPCMGGVGGGDEFWLDASKPALADPAAFPSILARFTIDHGIYSGFPHLYVEGQPASETIPDLPEGMPIVPRFLLDAMDGFDEGFGEWGADKEEFIDRLKGGQNDGLYDIRILKSVLFWHQPHERDAGHTTRESRARQDERRRRTRLIANNATWWRVRLDRMRTAMVMSNPETAAAIAFNTEYVDDGAIRALHHFAASRAARSRGVIGVLGRGAHRVSAALNGMGMTTRAITMTEMYGLGHRDLAGLITVCAFDALDPDELTRVALCVSRICGGHGVVVLAEPTRLSGNRGMRAPLEYQRRFPGVTPVGKVTVGTDMATIFSGRLVR